MASDVRAEVNAEVIAAASDIAERMAESFADLRSTYQRMHQLHLAHGNTCSELGNLIRWPELLPDGKLEAWARSAKALGADVEL